MVRVGDVDLSDFNPFDVRCTPRLYDYDRYLRTHHAHWRLGEGLHYLVSYDHIRAVLLDNETYLNRGGMRAPGVEIPHDDVLFTEMDPPLHPIMRRLLAAAFRRSIVKGLEDFAGQFANDRVAAVRHALDAGETVDLVAALTAPLVNAMTLQLLGFPLEDSEQIIAWTFEIMHSDWPAYNRRTQDTAVEGLEGFPDFVAYVDGHIARRRSGEAGQDLVTAFTEVEEDGVKLTDRQVRTAVAFMFFAGLSTATNAIGNALYELLSNPLLLEGVRADHNLVPAVGDESLRFRAPVTFLTRTAARDTVLLGAEVRGGERIILSLASAGRDEEVYGPDADSFRPGRPDVAPYISFGLGAHHCVGRELARIEACAALTAVVTGLDGIRLVDGFAFENVPVPFEWGPQRLDITVE